jgi:hypothetical protein
MSHTLLPDTSESLLSTLWSDTGGLIGSLTQSLLDAGKKGLLALPPATRLDDAAILAAQRHWIDRQDMAAMLRAKTQILMQSDDSLAPEYYNALYKHLSLHHIVVGRIDG